LEGLARWAYDPAVFFLQNNSFLSGANKKYK
jgi:hypothetical protein